MQKPFLQYIAEHYASLSRLESYCFVLPNRRSCAFFSKYLLENTKTHLLSPQITTISDLIEEFSGGVEANRIELLFILYHVYTSLVPENTTTFDKFARWGDVILSDFGDVERYMVNAEDLFRNISEHNAIKSTYITPELKEIMSHFFDIRDSSVDETNFWKHVETKNGEMVIKKEFTSIWNSLSIIYKKFIEEIQKEGISFGGKMSADAARYAKETRKEDFNYSKYVFIGFNVLSRSERILFNALKDKGIAEFHWDYNSPTFKLSENKGTKFLSEYLKIFKQELEWQENTSLPQNINVIGVPSNVGQAKYASELINKMVDNDMIKNPNNAINTAIILPDENLFLPVIKSIDTERIPQLNITMGVSIRNSNIATLMSSVSKMHYQAKSVHGEWQYFHLDVKEILLHPIIKNYAQEDILNLLGYMKEQNLYQISFNKICELAPNIKDIFTIVKDFTVDEITNYLHSTLDLFKKIIVQQESNSTNNLIIEEEENNNQLSRPLSLEVTFINKYREVTSQIIDTLKKYESKTGLNIKFDVSTFCYMIDRLVSPTKVPFEGNPLGGLQVMGVLETRCLDFENIIILSMNERIFPRKHFTKSFIPQKLRAGFKMATTEHQESMYAYYFYRLISRAKNVYMLYDSRSQGGKSGEESRFIHQLKALYSDKCTIKHYFMKTGLKAPLKHKIQIKKDQRIMEILNRFRAPLPLNAKDLEEAEAKGNIRFLSAHSINTYINCPIQFYLRYIERLAEIEETSEFMSSATFGTIVHNSLQEIFEGHNVIDTEFIDNLLDPNNKFIINTIIKNINKEFLRKGDNCYDELQGESMLKKDVAKVFIHRVLNQDKEIIKTTKNNIEYLAGEEVIKKHIDINGVKFNLSFIIDRLDRITENGEKITRIVDYKTGVDPTRFASMHDLFEAEASKRCKAILQLLLYCLAYKSTEYYTNGDKIRPIIYKIIDMDSSGIFAGTLGTNIQVEFPTSVMPKTKNRQGGENIEEFFSSELSKYINDLFDPNVPFCQASHENNCKYCKFNDFCRKELKEYQK